MAHTHRQRTRPCYVPLIEHDPHRHPLLPPHCLERGRLTHRLGRIRFSEIDLPSYHVWTDIGFGATADTNHAQCVFLADHPQPHLRTPESLQARYRLRAVLAAIFAVALHRQQLDDEQRLNQIAFDEAFQELSTNDFVTLSTGTESERHEDVPWDDPCAWGRGQPWSDDEEGMEAWCTGTWNRGSAGRGWGSEPCSESS
ncbi:hypothetical protein B0H14DRAFT_3487377 [Mycena olivaceomarginata]|nr:hypothetical protein B0H14DRAFT_3487377 [Mycena olivaceomarginata]